MKNMIKYENYSFVFNLLKYATEQKMLSLNIAAITFTESLIADRCYSYLKSKNNNLVVSKKNKFVSTFKLVKECEKNFKRLPLKIKHKSGGEFVTKGLFEEAAEWLNFRNKIIHGFLKPQPGNANMTYDHFFKLASKTAKDGLRIASLIRKWYTSESKKLKSV